MPETNPILQSLYARKSVRVFEEKIQAGRQLSITLIRSRAHAVNGYLCGSGIFPVLLFNGHIDKSSRISQFIFLTIILSSRNIGVNNVVKIGEIKTVLQINVHNL